jgi:hypothetical protein
MSAGRLNVLAVTGLSGVLTLLGQGYGSAELPHTAACVTVIVPLAGLGWLLRSVLPPLAALALVLFIQVSA